MTELVAVRNFGLWAGCHAGGIREQIEEVVAGPLVDAEFVPTGRGAHRGPG
jgi:hypothetical protein